MNKDAPKTRCARCGEWRPDHLQFDHVGSSGITIVCAACVRLMVLEWVQHRQEFEDLKGGVNDEH